MINLWLHGSFLSSMLVHYRKLIYEYVIYFRFSRAFLARITDSGPRKRPLTNHESRSDFILRAATTARRFTCHGLIFAQNHERRA